MVKKLHFYAIAFSAGLFLLSCREKKQPHTHENTSHVHSDKLALQNQGSYFGAYELEDENFGTKTKVTLSADTRTMVTNSLPNHKTGEYPRKGNPNTISAQNKTYTFPLNPKYTGKAEWIREPGIALNGIKFEPGTAEVVICESGENYRVEAFQNLIDLGLDFNNAHVQPTGAYHYHGIPTGAIDSFDSEEDLLHVGFAHDGFPMYYSKKGTYKPSFKLVDGTREGEDCTYSNPKQTIDVSVGGHHDGTFGSDFEFVSGSGDLDECNGITIDDQYMYLVTSEFPYVSRCLMGELQSQRRGAGGERPERKAAGNNERPRGRDKGAPNVDEIFKQMDTNADGKIVPEETKRRLRENFEKVDANDDGFISMEELKKDLAGRKGPDRRK